MAARILPSQDYLRQCFNYEAETGVLRWRGRPLEHFKTIRAWKAWNSRQPGKIAGWDTIGGHQVWLNGVPVKAHRVIWKWMTGDEPPKELDHRNRRPNENWFDNLRPATRSQQMHNLSLQKNIGKANGLKGVVFTRNRFRAHIQINGKRRWLGTFYTAEEAHAAYCKAAQGLFGEFWCSG